jgi:hypothetical protein
LPVVFRAVRRIAVFLSSHSLSCSPRPTPVVVDAVRAHPQAHDCIQVRLLGPSGIAGDPLSDGDLRATRGSPWAGPQKWSPRRTTSLGGSRTSTRSCPTRAQQR